MVLINLLLITGKEEELSQAIKRNKNLNWGCLINYGSLNSELDDRTGVVSLITKRKRLRCIKYYRFSAVWVRIQSEIATFER